MQRQVPPRSLRNGLSQLFLSNSHAQTVIRTSPACRRGGRTSLRTEGRPSCSTEVLQKRRAILSAESRPMLPVVVAPFVIVGFLLTRCPGALLISPELCSNSNNVHRRRAKNHDRHGFVGFLFFASDGKQPLRSYAQAISHGLNGYSVRNSGGLTFSIAYRAP